MKNKKLLLSLGSITAVIAPVVAVVACGGVYHAPKPAPVTVTHSGDNLVVNINKSFEKDTTNTASDPVKNLSEAIANSVKNISTAKNITINHAGSFFSTNDLNTGVLPLTLITLKDSVKMAEWIKKDFNVIRTAVINMYAKVSTELSYEKQVAAYKTDVAADANLKGLWVDLDQVEHPAPGPNATVEELAAYAKLVSDNDLKNYESFKTYHELIKKAEGILFSVVPTLEFI